MYTSQHSAFFDQLHLSSKDTDIILSHTCISILTGCSCENTSSHENRKRKKKGGGEEFIISHKLL